MNIQLSKLALAAFLPAIILSGLTEITAQSRSIAGKAKATRKVKPKIPSKPAREVPAKPLLSPQPAPVSIVNLAEPDYLSARPV